MFINRQQAGLLLAKEVGKVLKHDRQFGSQQTVVLGLPRGGVPVALEIAMILNCQLDIIAAKKIGAPDQPELAIGAVTSDGVVVVDHRLVSYLKVAPLELESEKQYLIKKTKKLETTWRKSAGLEEQINVRGKRVIVVDDGVATGMTSIAAARSLRNQGASELIFATPVASHGAYDLLNKEYDHVIVLEIPLDFHAVGQFYTDFCAVEDLEVVGALALARNRLLSGAPKNVPKVS